MRACKVVKDPKFPKLLTLRSERIMAGLTQVQLAGAVGIDRGYLTKIEAGLVMPSNDVLKLLCKELKVDDWKSLLD
jgi:transcriptional regulator with XRE-family HTH domain